MTPVIPLSSSNVALFPGTTFISRKNSHLTRINFSGRPTNQTSSSQRFLLPVSTSIRLFSRCAVKHGLRVHSLAATGTDIAVEEPDSAIASEDAEGTSEASPSTVATDEAPVSTADATIAPATQSKRTRPMRKSEMPPVKNEELVPGATFMGKVRTIQPFGAFVDFGAFTDGLVHVSQLSDNFVKDVGSIVSIGQEVKVRLVEANTETGRISLSMRENNTISKVQQSKEAPTTNDNFKPRPAKRNTNQKRGETQKSSKFVKGQELDGTVKNLNRAGAFISLPEGEEGFLPTSEESDEGFANMMGGSSLQAGQEVRVRVLRITRGQITLTMKKEDDVKQLNSEVVQGVVHEATNPFFLAFRKNKDIAAFLDEKEKSQKPAEVLVSVPSVVDDVIKDDKISSEEEDKEVEASGIIVDPALTELVNTDENPENAVSNSLPSVDSADETIMEELSSESLTPEESVSSVNLVTEEAPVIDGVKEDGNDKSDPTTEVGVEQILSSESVGSSEVEVSPADEVIVKDDIQTLAPSAVDNEIPDSTLKKSDPTTEGGVEQILSSESVGSSEVEVSSADEVIVKDDMQTLAPSAVDNEIPDSTLNKDEKVEPIPEKNGSVTTLDGQADSLSSQDNSTKATISPALVKQLREETGAGMMDCKKALTETEGDLVKAQEFLRKKGLASADKKSSRVTAEGRIGSYIHDSRIGVLIEVNCETDFVSRGDIFKELVDDLAMQVAACPQVQYLVTDDIPEEIVNKEKEIEMQKEDLLSKPEQIRSKIVEGRIRKMLEEQALLEQPYIKNDKVIVKDWVKQTIAAIGENIKVKRFVRYNLGEGLEKKSQDFAAEVAAQTAAKESLLVEPSKDQPVAIEAKEAVEKPPTVTVSAALVKQLRDETGAGMMDCKKALAETGGDIEKAQEYLRKKGLSTADKKSSRLAAEGRIGSYIHDSRVGVLLEINCETDFVGRSEKFKELVDDLAMQVVACPQVQFVSIEDIPESIVSREKELEMQREDLQSKPENIRERIVEGQISKRLAELALLEQPFIRNDSVLVKDLVKQTVAALGENIKVRRFVRFTLGETIEGAEVATKA